MEGKMSKLLIIKNKKKLDQKIAKTHTHLDKLKKRFNFLSSSKNQRLSCLAKSHNNKNIKSILTNNLRRKL